MCSSDSLPGSKFEFETCPGGHDLPPDQTPISNLDTAGIITIYGKKGFNGGNPNLASSRYEFGMPIDTDNPDFPNQVAVENPVTGIPGSVIDRNLYPQPTYGYTPQSIMACSQANTCPPETIAQDIQNTNACLSEDPSNCNPQQITQEIK